MIVGSLGSICGSSSKASSNKSYGVTLVYVAFVTVALLVYHLIAEGQFSSVLTLSAVFQCLAFSILGIQVFSPGGFESISSQSLQLDAIALACRLSSTLIFEGYLPNDSTGDWMYQAFDGASLGMVLWILYRVKRAHRNGGETKKDELSAVPFVVGALVLGALLHSDLDDNRVFDSLWMCGLFASVVAVVPQLWMMTKARASVPALTCHFVAMMAIARMLSGSYMWHAHAEISCVPWIGDFNHSGYAVLAAHLVHFLLLGDFAYFYVKNLATAGLNTPLMLPDAWMV